ncbi:unnamed protein product [Linum trigynum]|uniref:Uncharacterized protein n=1 Tax=Linum trigynum TaxID=586398 RepID=A0AAV2FJW9_9ROSI
MEYVNFPNGDRIHLPYENHERKGQKGGVLSQSVVGEKKTQHVVVGDGDHSGGRPAVERDKNERNHKPTRLDGRWRVWGPVEGREERQIPQTSCCQLSPRPTLG